MVRVHLAILVNALLFSGAVALPPPGPLGVPLQHIPLAPGGKWESVRQTNLVYNSTTNRFITVVKSGSPNPNRFYKILSFDASTRAIAAEVEVVSTSGVRPLGIEVDEASNYLFISWGDSAASSVNPDREIPLRLDRFDLDTFAPAPTATFDVQFQHFELLPGGTQLVGLAQPLGATANYTIDIVEIGIDDPADRRYGDSAGCGLGRCHESVIGPLHPSRGSEAALTTGGVCGGIQSCIRG